MNKKQQGIEDKKLWKQWRRTKTCLISNTYRDQKINSKRRGHQPPQYTLNELSDWIYNQPQFDILYQAWKQSNYQKELKPSIDRLKDNKGYSFDNIQIVTWEDNHSKEINHRKKPVLQKSLDGRLIKEWPSITAAIKAYGSTLNNCIYKNRESAFGYKWEMK